MALAYDPSDATYIATGTFENIDPSAKQNIYVLDGRYSDRMNEASIFGKVLVRDTERYPKTRQRKFIRETGIRIPDDASLFVSEESYWFVSNTIVSLYL